MIKSISAAVAAAVLVSVPALSPAAVLVQYTFDGYTQPASSGTAQGPFDASTVNADATATQLASTGQNINVKSGGTHNANSTSATLPVLRVPSPVTADAIDISKYFEFAVAPKSGYVLDLTNITFQAASNTTGNQKFEVRYSFDGFANSFTAGSGTTNAAAAFTYDNFSFNLLDANAGANETTGTTTFRFYNYNSGGVNPATYDNITVNGAVSAVPEPASLGLLGVAGAMFLRRRRA